MNLYEILKVISTGTIFCWSLKCSNEAILIFWIKSELVLKKRSNSWLHSVKIFVDTLSFNRKKCFITTECQFYSFFKYPQFPYIFDKLWLTCECESIVYKILELTLINFPWTITWKCSFAKQVETCTYSPSEESSK